MKQISMDEAAETACKARGVVNSEADLVITTLTSAPANLNTLTTSGDLYAAIPPETIMIIFHLLTYLQKYFYFLRILTFK